MADYSTDLKNWGATGEEWPDGYSWEDGNQVIDVWENYFRKNVIDDINHLIDRTNDELLEKTGGDLTGDLQFESDNEIRIGDNVVYHEGNFDADITSGTFEVGTDLFVGNTITSGGTTSSELFKHQTTITKDITLEEGTGTVLAGPITIGEDGSISGEGNMVVIDETTNPIDNPLQANIDANNYTIENLSSLSVNGSITSDGQELTNEGWVSDNFLNLTGGTLSGDLDLSETNELQYGSENFSIGRNSEDTNELLLKSFRRFSFYSEDNQQSLLNIRNSGNVNVPNGELEEQGERVSTRSWSSSEFVDNSGDTMSGDLDMGGNSISDLSGFVFNYPERVLSSGGISFDVDDGTGSPIRALRLENDNANVNVANGNLTEQDERVATRTWVDGELENYDADSPKIFVQETEPSETPDFNDGTAAIWYPLIDQSTGEYGPVHLSDGTEWVEIGQDMLEFDFFSLDLVEDLPEPENVEKPTIAYVDETDDYVGVFQE